MTRACRTCTRLLALEQFRFNTEGHRLRQCKQCENADRAFRRMPKAERPADPLNLALRDWASAEPAQLRQAI